MTALKRVLIMAGGTGGHVFPGLAVARFLSSQGVEVHWLGTERGLEAKVVREAGIPLHTISITGIRGKGLRTLLAAPVQIVRAVWQANNVLKAVKPDVVIGMGGFASGPGGLASWMKRCPLIIHEQNAKAGLTNKLLSRLAKKVLAGFPDAFNSLSQVVGNPVRQEIEQLPSPSDRFARPSSRLRLLVLGGSLGAQALNEKIPEAIRLLPETSRPEIIHQTGEKHFSDAKKHYETSGVQAKLVPFVEDMAAAYAWADLVICRAGALTVAELCSVGLGAIFVPFPFAVDDHQTANAHFMVKREAAICVQQSDLTVSRLAAMISELSQQPDKRVRMAKAAYELRSTNVAAHIYQICKEVCH